MGKIGYLLGFSRNDFFSSLPVVAIIAAADASAEFYEAQQILAVRAYVSAKKLTGHSFTTFDQISRHF